MLHGEIESLVVLYGYQIGAERDRNHWQYLVAFDPQQRAAPFLQVGGGLQRFSDLRVENRTITLSGKAYGPGDAMASPSAPVAVVYFLQNGRLMAKARDTR